MKSRKQWEENRRWEKVGCMQSCILAEARVRGGESIGRSIWEEVGLGIIRRLFDA